MRSRGVRLVACLSLLSLPLIALAAEEPPISTTEVHCTVLPGERVIDLARRLEEQGLSSPEIFLRLASTAEFPAFPFVPAPRPNLNRFEGLFAPGRYTLSLGGVLSGSLSHAQKTAFTRELARELLRASARRFRRFHSRTGLSLAQSIILASIVEKESVNGSDYRRIASVFVNRLRARMALASCPSVEYSLGYHRPYLLLSDIKIDSPYNLYLHLGLPPTPIAFFSDAAFRSVMDPPETAYNFFVFDWARGKHYFAADYAGHEVNMEISTKDFIAAYGAGRMFTKYPTKYYQY
jgi:UPF0755 protein